MKAPSILAACLLAGGLAACAPERDSADADTGPVEAAPLETGDAGLARVRQRLAKLMPEIKPEDVKPTVAPGVYQVQQGHYFGYVTADGTFLIQGDMMNLESGEEITENQRKSDRVAKLDDLGEANMIVFAPESVPQKYAVTVFTDIDCGYCRKLHSEMASYNEKGIAVRYVFYPRSGPDSPSYAKAEAVWCSTDRKAALTVAKLGAPIPGKTGCATPIMREWKLGEDFGLRGTPMIVLPDGEVMNGYVPADALATRLAALETGGMDPHRASLEGETQVQ